MGSPIPEIGPLRAPQGIHLALSVGVSALFWNLVLYWTTGSGPSWPEAPLALVYALILGLWSPWRQRTRQGPLLKLWIWIMATLLLYAGLALAEGRPWPQTFTFDGMHLLWFLPAFLQGQLTALWAGQLTSRARLYQLIGDLPSGKLLEDRVRDFQLDADFSRGNEATLSASLLVLSALSVGAAIFSPFGRDGISSLLAVAFLVFCLLVGVLLRTYRREMEALMYGRRFSMTEKLTPLGWSILLLVLAGLSSWGLMALGGPWVDWNQLLQGQHQDPPLPQPDEAMDKPMNPAPDGHDYRLAVLMALLQIIFRFRNILVVVEFTIRALAWLVPFAIGGFLVWPLVRWLLSGGRETKGLGRRWWGLLVEQWKAFLKALRAWWKKPLLVEGSLPEASNAREWLAGLFRRPPSGRRKPYPEVVEAFLSLVRWAEPVIGYRTGETTREYLDRLSETLADQSSLLAEVRDLLDKELFGPRGLDAAGRREFLSLVAALTAVPPSHDPPQGVS